MNNVIYALTRGYNTLDGYNWLIQRNDAIYEHITYKWDIPLVLFHEGNIPEHHQQHINERYKGNPIKFVNIAEVWTFGYEGMCRFNILESWKFLSEYDLALRIDEDCIISKCETNPFELIKEDEVYLKSVYWGESHSETNATLPQFIEFLTGTNPEKFYNHKFPYTNVGLARVSFFTQPPINILIHTIGTSELQRINRWGDLPVIGSVLNIFAKNNVGTLTGLSYHHISHNTIIECQ